MRQRAGVLAFVPVWGRGRAGPQFLTRPVPLPLLLGAGGGGGLPLCAWGALTPIPSAFRVSFAPACGPGEGWGPAKVLLSGLWSLGILL